MHYSKNFKIFKDSVDAFYVGTYLVLTFYIWCTYLLTYTHSFCWVHTSPLKNLILCIKFSTHITITYYLLPNWHFMINWWHAKQYISNRIWAKFTENESSSNTTRRYNIKLMYSYCKLPLAKLKERIQSAVPKFYVPIE